MEPAIEEFSVEALPQSLREKVGRIVKLLNSSVINMKELRELCDRGIPDEASYIRSVCWKLLLGYLPEQRAKWASVTVANEKTYADLVRAFLPEERFPDYPLVMDKHHPRWGELQNDFLLWQQIEKDTSRTHADLAFFSTPCRPIMIPFLTGSRKEKHRLVNGDELEKYHEFMGDKELQRITYKYHVMTRILFVYSRLNPRVGYVQGMNELLAPIFYLVNSHRIDDLEEASCFFMLNNAVSSVLDMHMKDLDSSESGISGKVAAVNRMLFLMDRQIHARLDELKIEPFFYCFRWLSLLFAQEFQLFDVIRLWDSMFARTNRVQYANYIAIAILISHKETIMEHEFITVLEHLQNLKFDSDVEQIVAVANELEKKWGGRNLDELYDKQQEVIRREAERLQRQQGKERGILGGFKNLLN